MDATLLLLRVFSFFFLLVVFSLFSQFVRFFVLFVSLLLPLSSIPSTNIIIVQEERYEISLLHSWSFLFLISFQNIVSHCIYLSLTDFQPQQTVSSLSRLSQSFPQPFSLFSVSFFFLSVHSDCCTNSLFCLNLCFFLM